MNDALIIANGCGEEQGALLPHTLWLHKFSLETGIREGEWEQWLMNTERVGVAVAESQLVDEWTCFLPYDTLLPQPRLVANDAELLQCWTSADVSGNDRRSRKSPGNSSNNNNKQVKLLPREQSFHPVKSSVLNYYSTMI